MQQSAPTPSDTTTETRRDRIARITAAGGLAELPIGFDERDGDWESVRSDDPFEVLYLDGRQWMHITQDTVERHYRLLSDLWRTKKLRMHSGAAGRQIAMRYGGEDNVDRFPALVDAAYRRIGTQEGREREFRQIDTERRERGERAIAKMVNAYLHDGLLEPGETDALLADGVDAGLTPDETAEYIEDRLHFGGFRADAIPLAEPPAARLRSVSWRTAKRRAEDDARRAGNVAPFKFEQGAAISLEELVALCDRYPEEAAGYMYRGYFETWLSGRLGDAPLAARVRAARVANPDDPSKGLEVAVRLILVQTGIRPQVSVRASTPAIALGEIPVGASASAHVELNTEGRTRVWGSVRVEPALPGLAVQSAFELPGNGIDIGFDSTDVAPGDYSANLVIEPIGANATSTVRVSYRVLPLVFQPQPASFALGELPFGESRAAKVVVATSPAGGRLVGSAKLLSPHPGVRLVGNVGGSASELTVEVDSRQFRAGERYESVVRFDTNAGPLEVPVSFQIGLRTKMVAMWAAGSAIAGAATLWLVRELLANVGGFEGWYSTIGSIAGLSSQQAKAAAVLAGAILAGAWYVRRRVRGNRAKDPPDTDVGSSVAARDSAGDIADDADAAPRSRANAWPMVSFALLVLAVYFSVAYPDGMSPTFWTFFAATGAGVLGWRRGKLVKRGRKRAALLSFIAACAAALSFSPSALSAGTMGQWQPFAEWTWSLGASPAVARNLGPSKGVRRSLSRAARDDREGAVRAASDAVRAREDDADAWLLLAAYSLDARDYDRAYSEALRAQQLRPASGTVLAAVGAILVERNRTDLAMRALRAAVTNDPGSEAANFVYGCTLAANEATASVASLFLRRAAAASDDPQVSSAECTSAEKPYSRARWWASVVQHEYDARLRQASKRVADLPLPRVPGTQGTSGESSGERDMQGDV